MHINIHAVLDEIILPGYLAMKLVLEWEEGHHHTQGRIKTKWGLMLRCKQGNRPIIVTIRD